MMVEGVVVQSSLAPGRSTAHNEVLVWLWKLLRFQGGMAELCDICYEGPQGSVLVPWWHGKCRWLGQLSTC